MNENKWVNACECYYWVRDHPKLQFEGCCEPWIEITPHMVDPTTKCVEDSPEKNTEMVFWVECGAYVWCEYSKSPVPSHDWELDCGGSSWEVAVIELGKLVLAKHGDYDE